MIALIARWVCVGIGATFVALVGYATYRDVEDAYAFVDRLPARLDLHEPTIDASDLKPEEVQRYLVQCIVLRGGSTSDHTLSAYEWDLRWPRDDGRDVDTALDLGPGLTAEITIRPWTRGTARERRPYVSVRIRARYESQLRSGSSSSSRPLRAGEPWLYEFEKGRWGPNRALSLARFGPVDTSFVLLARPVDSDDPLRAADPSGVEETLLSAANVVDLRTPPTTTFHVGAAALFEDSPFSGVLLLVAVLFLALGFRRRSTGFVVASLAVMAFVVAADRAVLQTHLRTLAEPTVSAPSRQVALDGLRGTFFYRDTAADVLEEYGL